MDLFISVFIFKFAFFLKETSLYIILFIYIFLAVLCLCCCSRSSPVVANRGCCPVLACRLCIAALLSLQGASVVAGHRLQQLRALRLGSVAHGLSCSEVRGLLPGRGSSPRLLHRQVDSSH